MKTTPNKIGLIIITIIGSLLLATGLTYWKNINQDLTNYTVSADTTQKLIAIFEKIPSDKSIHVTYGGTKCSTAKDPKGRPAQVANMHCIGIHMFNNDNRKVIRFSSSDHFNTTTLSHSLSENKKLAASFRSMLERTKSSDPYSLKWWKMGLSGAYDINSHLHITE